MPCGLLVNNTDRAAGAKDRNGFFACGKYDEVVCHMTGLDMRSDGYASKGQKFIAQRQAKRRPGLWRSLGFQPARVVRAMWHDTISSTDATSLCRWAKIHLTYSCLPQSHRMKFDSIDHLFILEQQFWNILLVIEFPDIFFL